MFDVFFVYLALLIDRSINQHNLPLNLASPQNTSEEDVAFEKEISGSLSIGTKGE